MIPKVIHYCWFGRNPLPQLALKCIESWKKYFPDYEIKEWNEDNFDVNLIPYTQEAYEAKKYAFVSDYARFWILYHYGGLYFDTDVEVIKNMDSIIARGPFMGCEKLDINNNGIIVSSDHGLGVNPGLGLGADPGLSIYKDMLELYSSLHFIDANGNMNIKTIVSYISELLFTKGLKRVNDFECFEGIYFYSSEYFAPKNYNTGELNLTEKTVSIHHYMASWANNGCLNFIKYKVLMKFIPRFIIRYIVEKKRLQRDREIEAFFKD